MTKSERDLHVLEIAVALTTNKPETRAKQYNQALYLFSGAMCLVVDDINDETNEVIINAYRKLVQELHRIEPDLTVYPEEM